jgi:hypothetical protein
MIQYFALGTPSEIYYRNKNNYFDRQSLTTSTFTQYTYSFNEDLMTPKSLVSKCKYFQKQILCHQKSLNFPAVQSATYKEHRISISHFIRVG